MHYLFRDEVAEPGKSEVVDGPYLLALTHAYILGDKYGLGAFQNEVMRTFMRAAGDCALKPKWVVEMLTLLPTSSLLRKVVLEEVVYFVEHVNTFAWSDLKELATLDGVFEDILKAFGEYHGRDLFLPHLYGTNWAGVQEYMVSEKEGG